MTTYTFQRGETVSLALDVFTDIVLAGFQQSVAVFAFDVEQVCFSHRDF